MKVRTEERREAIIEAAAQLFQEMGYERASMNELAKRLGGSKGTLYNYFPSKEELFSAVIRTYATRHLTDAASALDISLSKNVKLAEKLQHFGEQMLNVMTTDNTALGVYRMVVAEAGHSEMGMLFYESGPRESVEKLARLFSSAMDNGVLRFGDSRIRALQFLALLTAEIEERIYQRMAPPLSVKRVQEMTACAVRMFMAGAANPSLSVR
ncbi:TetR/AcrR family transcriptional regulator [Erwinia amylovora]|uniref:TetR/AcrR family transcriptional regulator n=1 Tax=Erwinia amylovora TaxID=552 RepID=UPI001443C364|nr:TetR/AcrR family transcriptional regulator [Erwinia amylovora]